MNGPTIEQQKMMESPRKNRLALRRSFGSSKQTRDETLAILALK